MSALLRVLMLHICYLVPHKKIWTDVHAESAYDPLVDDVTTCWKGVGFNPCTNRQGWWHYPGMRGCDWWTDKMPKEIFDEVVTGSDPLRELVEKENLVFSTPSK